MSTTTQRDPYVFLSYPRTERVFAKRLEQDLQVSGLRVWRDESGISPGSPDWDEAIREAISHAYAVVFIASPSVIESLSIKGELNLAKRYHPHHVYPAWMSGLEWTDCVPIDFITTQYIDMRGEQYVAGLQILVSTLEKAKERSSPSQRSAAVYQQRGEDSSPPQQALKPPSSQQPYPQHQPHPQQPLIREQPVLLQVPPEEAPAPSSTMPSTKVIPIPALPVKPSEKAAPLGQLSQPAVGATLPHAPAALFPPPMRPSHEVSTKQEQQVAAQMRQKAGSIQFPQVTRIATSRLMYAVFFLLAVLIGSSVFFFAMRGNNPTPVNPPPTSPLLSVYDVHMGQTSFDPPSITIRVDDTINLINDSSVRHTFENGTWEGNIANPVPEPGAPEVNDMQFSAGQTWELGPFTSAGTFHYFCTDQPGMNLTITVR